MWTILFTFIHTGVTLFQFLQIPGPSEQLVLLAWATDRSYWTKAVGVGEPLKMLSGFHHRALFTSSSHQSRLCSLSFHLSFSFHLPPPFPLISSASLQRFPFVSFAFPSLLFCLILSLCLHVKQPGVCLVFSETKLTAGNPLKFVWAKCRTRLLCYFEIWGWRAGIWSGNPREATLFSAEPSSLRGSGLGRFRTISSWWWWW